MTPRVTGRPSLPVSAALSPSPARSRQAVERAAAGGAMESLETRLLWSVAQDANGWYNVTPSADSRVVYVSSSAGNDANSGLSPSAPVQSLGRGQSLMRSGMPDELLLKSGDTFYGSLQNWATSGRSAAEPQLIGSYGAGARPLIYTGAALAGFSAATYTTVNYVDLNNLQFDAQYRDPTLAAFDYDQGGGTTGFLWDAAGGNSLVQGCSFRCYRNNLDIEGLYGATGNFKIYRSVSADSWSLSSHSQGLYSYSTDRVSVVQSVFDHDGWLEAAGAYDSGFNHDMYFSSTTTNVDVEQNVIANASYSGVMARSGGTINNNLFVGNTVDVAFGDANGANSTIGGTTGSLVGNVVVGDKALGTLPFGQGFEVGNTKPGAGVLVANNVFTADTQYAKPAIQLAIAYGTNNPGDLVGLNDVTIQNNVVNGWYVGIQTDGGMVPGATGEYGLNNLKVLNNDFLNSTSRLVRHDGAYGAAQETWNGNRYYDTNLSSPNWFTVQSTSLTPAQWAQLDTSPTYLPSLPYADPNRTVATYDGTLGGPGTTADFLAQARLLSQANYRPAYMATAPAAYVRAGYALDTAPPTAAAATTNVNAAALGTYTYPFTVTYTDDVGLNTATLGSGNLLVTGPKGFAAPATYVSAAAPTVGAGGVQQTVVTYQASIPGGWAVGQDGTYAISLVPNQVKDRSGNAAPAATVGTFAVDLSGPTASAVAPDLTDPAALAGTGYAFAVTYADPSGVDPTTLTNAQVRVTGPNGYAQYATVGTVAAVGSTGLTVAYSVTAPAGQPWAQAAGQYAIAVAGGGITDMAGNPLAGGPLASFGVGSAVAAAAGSIAGFVYNDANGNGTFDPREVPLVGVGLFVDLAGTGVYAAGDPQTATDATGAYTFTSLPPGRYTVVEAVPAGYAAGSAGTGSTLTMTALVNVAGNAATVASFANSISTVTASTTGMVASPINEIADPDGGTTTTASPTTASPVADPTTGRPRVPVALRLPRVPHGFGRPFVRFGGAW